MISRTTARSGWTLSDNHYNWVVDCCRLELGVGSDPDTGHVLLEQLLMLISCCGVMTGTVA